MNEQALYCYTTMVFITAEQVAWSRGRDDATLQDISDASHMVWRWNNARIAMGLQPWI